MMWSLTPKKLHVSDMICLTKPLYQDQNEAIIFEKNFEYILRRTIRFKFNLWELKWRINLTINLKIGSGLRLT